MRIILKELAIREGEQVEWKENVADVEAVVATIVAFANDFSNLGGGYVVCGAQETKDEHGFQRLSLPGLTSSRFKEVEAKVLAECRDKVDPKIVPVIEELPSDVADRRVLVFVVPASPHAHSYRTKDASAFYVRIGRETRQARNGIWRELLVRKHALEPWDRRMNATATLEDIDLVVLREYLQRMSLWDPAKGIEDYLSPDTPLAAFVPPLCGREPLTGTIRPRNFALLLFGRQPTRFFPGAYSVFSLYPGIDRGEPHAERLNLDGSVVDQTLRMRDRLNVEAHVVFDKTDSEVPNLLKYPHRALQEAIVNALVHRDYERDQPVRVTVFTDRIEVNSPGPIPLGIKPEDFVSGRAPAMWRNQSLAYFFNKLQLAQSEGQGIPTIIRSMEEEGCPPPVFNVSEASVICTLPAHPRHEMMRQIQDLERDMVLGKLDIAYTSALQLLEKDPYNFRVLELFCEINVLRKTPEQIFEWLKSSGLDLQRLNPGTKLVVAETLASIPNRSRELIVQTNLLLKSAATGRSQEEEVRRIAAGLRKVGSHEEAVEILDRAMAATPALRDNASLLKTRGEASIDLAKRCMETARNFDSPPRVRARAWEQARSFLNEAERDLQRALEHSSTSFRDFVEKDLDFLRRMQDQSRPPQSTGRRRRNGTGRR